jgi:putative ABC transport system permease protein
MPPARESRPAGVDVGMEEASQGEQQDMGPFVLSWVAGRALARNKLRTALAALGIIIGVGAVICTVAIGEGATVLMEQAIASIGVNFVWVEAGSANVAGVRTGGYGTRTLVDEDMVAIKAQCALVATLSPQVDTSVQLIRGNLNWRSPVRGVTPEYLRIRDWQVVQGAPFTDADVAATANVAVLGQTVVERLFLPHEDPIGEIIRVKDKAVRVIGVLARKGATASGGDNDDTFLMPYTFVQKRIKGQTWLDDILCSAVSASAIPGAEKQITEILRARHRLGDKPDDFNLRHPVEMAQMLEEQTTTMELLVASIAAVSLLVGSIGIMNIMLVSVTERTREIGIRLAVGAKGRDIRWQFLVEAIILCLVGGGLGILAGVAGARVVAATLEWPVFVSPRAIVMALGISTFIGLFFGLYPASKAAGLDPIRALQFE